MRYPVNRESLPWVAFVTCIVRLFSGYCTRKLIVMSRGSLSNPRVSLLPYGELLVMLSLGKRLSMYKEGEAPRTKESDRRSETNKIGIKR